MTNKIVGIALILFVFILVVLFVSGNLRGSIGTLESKVGDLNLFFNSLTGRSYETQCNTNPVSSLSDGEDFLRSISIFGIDHSRSIIKSCKGFECTLNLTEVENYRLSKGKFFRQDSGPWEPNNWFIEGSLVNSRIHYELYHGILDLMRREGLKGIYDRGISGEFVLVGKRLSLPGQESRTIAYWYGGRWIVGGEEKVYYFGKDDSLALDKFYSIINYGLTYPDIYFSADGSKIGSFEDVSIDELAPIDSLLEFEDSQIDTDLELESLKKLFGLVKEKYLEKNKLSEVEMDRFRSLNGKTVSALGVSYNVEVESEDGYPLIKLIGPETYYLNYDISSKFYSDFAVYENGEKGYDIGGSGLSKRNYPRLVYGELFSSSKGEFKLRYYPGVFTDSSGEVVGDPNTYKLLADKYGEVYRGTQSYKFLIKRCLWE
ncbi:MAG: hypothetical protein IH845_05055 [Nanoarchaeota archaeon]|nr:hypothetical protein [Nanoarchaeota archaeon]